MWQSRTKIDLVIEVWEKLDCESVGAKEIEAVEWLIKELKRTVPIWKKEVYAGGEVWVEGEKQRVFLKIRIS